MDKYGWQSLLIIDDQEKAKGLAKFTKRLTNRDVLSVNGINVYDILRKDQLLITSATLRVGGKASMKSNYDIIRRPIITEKAISLRGRRSGI